MFIISQKSFSCVVWLLLDVVFCAVSTYVFPFTKLDEESWQILWFLSGGMLNQTKVQFIFREWEHEMDQKKKTGKEPSLIRALMRMFKLGIFVSGIFLMLEVKVASLCGFSFHFSSHIHTCTYIQNLFFDCYPYL